MAHINTLLGPVHPSEMGLTAIHEHLLWGPLGWESDPATWPDFAKAFEECYHHVMDYKVLGGQTFIDCTGIGMGRDLDFYIKMAESVRQVNIIAGTGFCAGAGMPPYFRGREMNYFEELFVREITQGMGRSAVKAGIISIGGGRRADQKTEKLLCRAAARASHRTGAAVIIYGVSSPLKALMAMFTEQFEPERVIISHVDSQGTADIERDKEIVKTGAYVAYDDIGIEGWSKMPNAVPDETRVEAIAEMVKAGLQDHILMSTGARCRVLGRGDEDLHNPSHLIRYFLPKLRQAGVKEETIKRILIDNPRRVIPIQ